MQFTVIYDLNLSWYPVSDYLKNTGYMDDRNLLKYMCAKNCRNI